MKYCKMTLNQHISSSRIYQHISSSYCYSFDEDFNVAEFDDTFYLSLPRQEEESFDPPQFITPHYVP